MKYLFIFAHPDDEAVACAGTIKQLTEAGEEVIVISATDGGAGEVSDTVRSSDPDSTPGQIRRREVSQVKDHLNIAEYQLLDFEDGQITNQVVWGRLTSTLLDKLEEIKPDVVVTFEHGGWYFHLDHVGVSIATTLAYHQSDPQPAALLLAHFRAPSQKWRYVFHDTEPITHQVEVSDLDHKLKSFDLHASQNLETPRKAIKAESQHIEKYELAFATDEGKQLLQHHPVFKSVE